MQNIMGKSSKQANSFQPLASQSMTTQARKRQRSGANALPLDAEGNLDTSKVTMKDLIRASRIGKPTKASQDSQDQPRTALAPAAPASAPTAPAPSPPAPAPVRNVFAPQVRIVNGEIVVSEDSLTVTARYV